MTFQVRFANSDYSVSPEQSMVKPKPPSIRLWRPPCDHVEAQPCRIRFVDYKGHSRFVLRILVILSHRSRKQGESLPPLWKLLTRRGRVVKALPYDKQR